jgi:hypothetical protein
MASPPAHVEIDTQARRVVATAGCCCETHRGEVADEPKRTGHRHIRRMSRRLIDNDRARCTVHAHRISNLDHPAGTHLSIPGCDVCLPDWFLNYPANTIGPPLQIVVSVKATKCGERSDQLDPYIRRFFDAEAIRHQSCP